MARPAGAMAPPPGPAGGGRGALARGGEAAGPAPPREEGGDLSSHQLSPGGRRGAGAAQGWAGSRAGSLRRVIELVTEAELVAVPRRLVRRARGSLRPRASSEEAGAGAGAAAPEEPAAAWGSHALCLRSPLFPEWLRDGLEEEALGEARKPPSLLRIAAETGLWYLTFAAAAFVALPCTLAFCLATFGVGLAVRVWGRARKGKSPSRWHFLRASRARKLELLERLCEQFGAESLWMDVPDPVVRGATLRVHAACIRHRAPPGSRRGSALFLHGLNSTSLMFADTMQGLSATHDCYALDLPGFGLSEGPAHVRGLAGAELLDWYAGVARNSAGALGLSPPPPPAPWGGAMAGAGAGAGPGAGAGTGADGERLLVGHSMGAMFSVRAASGAADPRLFTRLVLVAPPGLVPILGEMAAFLGLKIRLNFPECVFQYLGCVLCPVVNFWQTWRGSGDLALFRFQRYSDRAAFGSGLVRRLNRFSWTGYSTWHVTAMAELFRLRAPVLLVYGERDPLVPADQGELLVRMARNKLPCAVVRGAGHGMFLSDPDKMAGLLLRGGGGGARARRACPPTAGWSSTRWPGSSSRSTRCGTACPSPGATRAASSASSTGASWRPPGRARARTASSGSSPGGGAKRARARAPRRGRTRGGKTGSKIVNLL